MGEIFAWARPRNALEFTGERWTSTALGQIELEHLHRYLAARDLCRGRDVLDIACGEGYGAALLAQVARRVVGVDIARDALAHAANEYAGENLHFVAGDARRIPLATDSFDVAVSFETLEHFAEQERFLAELRRLLRPDGVLILSTPDSVVYSPIGGAANPYHVRELSHNEFVAALSEHFSHVAVLGQRPLVGSAIVPCEPAAGTAGPVTYERRDEAHFERSTGLPRAVYLIACASNRPLVETLGPSLYIHASQIDLPTRPAPVADDKPSPAPSRSESVPVKRPGADLPPHPGDLRATPGEHQGLSGFVRSQQPRDRAAGRNLASLERELAAAEQARDAAAAAHAAAANQLLALQLEHEAVISSTSWKATYPLRRWGTGAPPFARRLLRRAAGLASRSAARSARLRDPDTRFEEATDATDPTASLPRPVGEVWPLRRKLARSEIDFYQSIVPADCRSPLFAIVIVTDGGDDDAGLERSLESLAEQAHRDWHAVIVGRGDDALPRSPERIGAEFPELQERIHLAAPGPAESFAALIAPLARQEPDLLLLISAGDVLGADALLQLATAAALNGDADFFYSDERRLSPAGSAVKAFFKPQWSPELLLSTNYIGRLWCVRMTALERAGCTIDDWRRYGEYDLVLRCAEVARRVQHVPRLLCERAERPIDSPEQEREALSRALARRGMAGLVKNGFAPGFYELRGRASDAGLVSVIVPGSSDPAALSRCLSALVERTSYQKLEVIIIRDPPANTSLPTHVSSRDCRISTIDAEPAQSFGQRCDLGAAAARGEFLLFLHEQLEPGDPDWLDCLLRHAAQKEVAIVGGRLADPAGRVRHAGFFWAGRRARIAFRLTPDTDPGYFGLSMTSRNVLAVSGRCMMLRRDWFDAIGGFAHGSDAAVADLDTCLRCLSLGGRVVYEPGARFRDHGVAQPDAGPSAADCEPVGENWGHLLKAGDPYYHQNLSAESDDYAINDEPVREILAGTPLYDADRIARILAVKLDHIGDFITAVPALKRLHQQFPNSRLYLLAPKSTNELARALVPEITEVINFEFFHVRSQFGERLVGDAELVELEDRLKPYRFDLAIDLRKHPQTRNVLRFTGARWLVGYNSDDRFGWLDVAVEMENDARLVKKRSHIGTDLCRLVEAAALAGGTERRILAAPAAAIRQDAAKSGPPLVLIHPGVGTETRRWPAEHFAALIDLLIAHHEADIVLIGAPEEADVANQVLRRVREPDRVRSLVGETRLGDLPALVASAALFIGNNSGPQHIAAGLGVPTIGLYSGVVDAREWGPVGPNAVALQRQMRCSPCHLGSIEECWRRYACMTQLYPAQVYAVARQMLRGAAAAGTA